jgi:hypothetical protein
MIVVMVMIITIILKHNNNTNDSLFMQNLIAFHLDVIKPLICA